MEFAEFIRTPMVDGVVLNRPNVAASEGTLCVTGHHLILSSRSDQREELWLLHKNVDSVEKKLFGSGGTLTLKCKDFQQLTMTIPSAEDCLNIANSVEQLSNIENVGLLYPFFYRPMFEVMEDGWQAFLPEMEFSRLQACSEDWRLSLINRNYEVCGSYPQTVVVPKSVDDETIFKAATFRKGGRFPVLSYYHKENGMAILRSSQPLTQNNRRCKEDERLLNAVLGAGGISRRGYIVDTRSPAQAKQGGVEPEVNYSQWRRLHQSIERHHTLHESLIKMMEACNDTGASMDKWLSKLDSSGWLTHVKDILTCACVIAQCIDKEGASVLVHGTDGLDSTLQVSSLAQLLLDPDCRTIRGFEALVEREWLQAGHPFTERCAKSAFAVSRSRNEAPVFLIYIDCVWQIWQQFPCSFEFNEEFLIMLFQHAYASQFGTFMCNSDKERKENRLAERTVSLWSYVNRPEILTQYMNPLYEPNGVVLWPSVAAQSLLLWSGLYQRWQRHAIVQQDLWEEIGMVKEQDKALQSKAIKLRNALEILIKSQSSQNTVAETTPDS